VAATSRISAWRVFTPQAILQPHHQLTPSLVIAVAKEPATSIYRAPSPNDPNNAILRAAAARRKQELKKKQRYLGGQVPFATWRKGQFFMPELLAVLYFLISRKIR
jgi:hypothetical protein